jgi:hypothetical protein
MTLPEKIKIIGLVLFFSLFVGLFTARATLYDIVHYDASTIGGVNRTWMAFNFTPTADNISGIYLPDVAGNPGSKFFVCKGTMSYAQFNSMYSGQGNNITSCGAYDQIAETDYITPTTNFYDFGVQYTLTPSSEYFIIFKQYNSGTGIGNAISYDKYATTYLYGDTFDFSPYYDARFSTAFDGYPPPEFFDYIFPEHPLDGETVFSNDGSVDFIGTYENYLGVLFEITVYPPEGLPIVFTRPELQTHLTPEPYDIPIPLLPGDYSYMIQTRMANDSIATTTYDRGLINFTFSDYRIPTSTAQFAMPNGLSVETVCDGIATSTIMGGIECGFKRVIYWAFYPSNNALLSLQSSITNVKNSFPFNAFFDLTDTIDDAIGTSTPNMAGTIDLPFINGSGDYIMLPVIASSSLSNLIGSTNATLFRNSITWFLWACAGVLVFLTFKKL